MMEEISLVDALTELQVSMEEFTIDQETTGEETTEQNTTDQDTTLNQDTTDKDATDQDTTLDQGTTDQDATDQDTTLDQGTTDQDATEQDTTDSVKVTVTEEIHETLVNFRDDNTTGRKCTLIENVIEDIVKIVIIDSDDFGEDTAKPDEYKLGEILCNIEPLANIIEAKQSIAKDLLSSNIAPADLSDFYLGCMSLRGAGISILNVTENSIHNAFEQSLSLFYLASLLLDHIWENTENAQTKQLLKYLNEHLVDARSALENALKVHGWLVPDLEPTREKFDEFKAKLASLADQYVNWKSGPEFRFASAHNGESGSELLRQHKQLVINYEIVSEVEDAIAGLRDVFRTMRAEVLDERESGSFVYAEVSERSTVWEFPENHV